MKKIGLACTGGGTKAASNVGVIKAFEEANIKITAISGTSIGSIVAVMYSIGYKPDEILEKLKYCTVAFPHFSFLEKILAPFRFVIRGGCKNPNIIAKTVDDILLDKNEKLMSDIEMPCFIPTLDITNKETVYYTSKDIIGEICYKDRPISEAIKNTTSLPLLFIPNTVFIDGKMHQFLDGGMTNNTPTTHLKEFSDVVIGIENVYRKLINQKKANIITGIRNCFQGMRRSAVVFQKEYADFWIEVDCGDVDIIGSKEQIEYCYQQGYKAAKEFLSKNLSEETITNNS